MVNGRRMGFGKSFLDSVVTSKWIYKIKDAIDGRIEKYKARFFTRGFSQKEGIDYEETFTPTYQVYYYNIFGFTSHYYGMQYPLNGCQFFFLNGTIGEEVYIEQPEGFEINSKDTHVCRLKKALYGLKQAPRAWYARMDAYLLRIAFVKSFANANLYIKIVKNEPVIIILYVDDLFITVWQKSDEIYLGQGKYIIKMLQKFGMMDSKPLTTPMIANLKKLRSSDSSLVGPTSYRKLVGFLTYLVNTGPNICFAINFLSQVESEPRHDHWIAAKHILRDIRGTIHHRLKYDGKEVKLTGFSNFDWDGRNTTGGCFSLGSAMISWISRKQDPVASSSAEAEYDASCEVGKEVVWLRKILSNLFGKPLDPTMINCDNQSNIKMFKDHVFHVEISKSNLLEISLHYLVYFTC
eukprot:PITA_01547